MSDTESKISKPIKVNKAMEFLISKIISEKKHKSQKKKEILNEITEPKETFGFLRFCDSKKTKKELMNEIKSGLKLCKGKTKDNKECNRKETINCNGFCKQHFIIEKEKANTIELIEKHMKH